MTQFGATDWPVQETHEKPSRLGSMNLANAPRPSNLRRRLLVVAGLVALVVCQSAGREPNQESLRLGDPIGGPASEGQSGESLTAVRDLPTLESTPLARVAAAEPDERAIREIGFGIASLDAVMRATLKKYDVPGASLAVAKDGKLVMAKGYGWAVVATRRPVAQDSPFCLASVSKAITSVAILRLVQDGKLSLDDRVYALLGRPLPLDGFQLDPRIKDITVRQLLLHAGGFDPKKGGDYLHMSKKIAKQTGSKLPIADDLLIRYAFSRPLARAGHGIALFKLRLLLVPRGDSTAQADNRTSSTCGGTSCSRRASPTWRSSGCNRIMAPTRFTATARTASRNIPADVAPLAHRQAVGLVQRSIWRGS